MTKIMILYKAGQTVTTEVEHFEASFNALGELVRIRWEGEPEPYPIFMGVSNIAAIWEVFD